MTPIAFAGRDDDRRAGSAAMELFNEAASRR